MSSSDEEILDLIARLQTGIDVDASSRRLFEILRPRLISFFLRYRFSTEEAQDLTQETFFRVFRGIGTFRRESRFERWLFEIAGNVYRNELRRRGAVKREGRDEPLDIVMERDPVSDRPVPTSPRSGSDPLAEVLEKERLEELRRALEAMPPQMRRCLFLRIEQGLKYREIAVVMKISIDTVKAHLHQARQRLKEELGEGLGE